jgi:hypothetical protein
LEAAFVVLHQRAHEETDLKPTVKELDYPAVATEVGGG